MKAGGGDGRGERREKKRLREGEKRRRRDIDREKDGREVGGRRGRECGYERRVPHFMCETRVQRAADGPLDKDKLWGRLCDGDDYCSAWFDAFAQCVWHIFHPISDEYCIKVGTELALLY